MNTQTLEVNPTLDNVCTVMDLCGPEHITEGMEWYREAYAIACELVPEDPSRGAGILAALSPLTSWPLNVRRAREVASTGTTGGLPASVAKAERIWQGEASLDVLGGDKVLSFYRNIMGDDSHVTVDRHAIDVACGRPMTDAERALAIRGKAGYGRLADIYRAASQKYGYTPSQIQAIVWVWWRENKALANHGRVK